MSQFIAFARYSLSPYRIYLIACYAAALLGMLLVLLFRLLESPPAPLINFAAFIAGFAWWGLMFSSVVIFGFNQRQAMVSSSSMYDHLVLRLPLTNRQLLSIPLALLAIWIVIHWLLGLLGTLLLTSSVDIESTTEQLLLVILCVPICLCCAATWVVGLTWHPFAKDWYRLAALVALVTVMGTGMIVGAVAFQENWRYRFAVLITVPIFYACGIVVAARGIRLARISSGQQSLTAAHADDKAVSEPYQTRVLLSPNSALAWHDRKQGLKRTLRLSCTLLPVLVLVGLVAPPRTWPVVLLVIGGLAATYSSAIFEPSTTGVRCSLPSYLAMLPISHLTLARSRLRTFVQMYLQIFLASSTFLLLTLLFREHRSQVAQWWNDWTYSIGWDAPLRIGFVSYVGILMLCLSLALRGVCVQWFGRQWLVLTLTLALPTILFAIGVVCFHWFTGKNSWEAVERDVSALTQWWAPLVCLLMIVKLAWLTFWFWRSWKSQLTSWATHVFLVWTIVCVFMALGGHWLWPLGNVNVLWFLAGGLLTIPLSPWLIAPIAIEENRHRRA